ASCSTRSIIWTASSTRCASPICATSASTKNCFPINSCRMTSHGEERSPVNSPVPPTRDELQHSLRTLHEELTRTARIDAGSHALLQQLLGDMQRLLQDSKVPVEAAATERPARR